MSSARLACMDASITRGPALHACPPVAVEISNKPQSIKHVGKFQLRKENEKIL